MATVSYHNTPRPPRWSGKNIDLDDTEAVYKWLFHAAHGSVRDSILSLLTYATPEQLLALRKLTITKVHAVAKAEQEKLMDAAIAMHDNAKMINDLL